MNFSSVIVEDAYRKRNLKCDVFSIIYYQITIEAMKIFYITLNNNQEAQQISRQLLEQKLAVCTNWFPITCAYSWQGEIKEEPEVVLIVKTQTGYRAEIEAVIQKEINYTNCIAEITVNSVNDSFAQWLNAEIVPQS